MSAQEKAKSRSRFFYIDNIRIYLTILVIFHHAALAYGGAGSWSVEDDAVDDISPILLVIFNAVNQTYFMSAFFLFAGYFTPRSLDRKGSPKFLQDRLIRLGIPLLIYSTIIVSLNHFIVRNFAEEDDVSIWDSFEAEMFDLDFGHLWFLQALFLFAGFYIIFRFLADRFLTTQSIQIYRDRFPPNTTLFLCIGILALLTFGVRLIFPVGEWFLNVQPGHFVHYTFCFYSGVLAYHGEWLRRLSESQARRWGTMSLAVLPLLLAMMGVHLALGGSMEDEDVELFQGGLHWQAFTYAVWETFLCVGIIIFILYFFREKVNQTGPVAKSMASNVYTVYIIHQTIVIILHILLLDVNIPTILKFFIVGLIAVPLCFLLSILIRRVPGARRVLG